MVAKTDSELSVLAVDAGCIAVRTETGLRLITAAGRVLRDIDVKPQAAALSGNRLAVRTASAVGVYDAENGERLDRLSVAKAVRLEDLDGDILVTAWGGAVTLRRLGDGSTTKVGAGRTGLGATRAARSFRRQRPPRDVHADARSLAAAQRLEACNQ